MYAYVINERDMAGNEDQAAFELLPLLTKGEKVIFILSEEIPTSQMFSVMRKIGVDKNYLYGKDVKMLSYSRQIAKSVSLCSILEKAKFKPVFCQGFYHEGKFTGKTDTVEVFANRGEIEELLSENNLLILIPCAVPENVLTKEKKGKLDFNIDLETKLNSVEIVNNRSSFSVFFEEDSNLDILNLLENIKSADISLDMINICYDELHFISENSSADKIEKIISDLGFKYSRDDECAKVMFLGVGIKGVPGIMDKIFEAFDSVKVDIMRTTDSHTTISCLINANKIDKIKESAIKILKIPAENILED